METLNRRQLLAGFIAFLAGWSTVSLRQWWENRNHPYEVCLTNLRIIYATFKTIAPAGNLRAVSVEEAALALRDGIRVPPKLVAYISRLPEPTADEQGRGTLFMGAQTSLICPADPDFTIKAMLSRAPTLGFQSSYHFFPNLHTVAYCPYHRLSVWQDGTIHEERL